MIDTNRYVAKAIKNACSLIYKGEACIKQPVHAMLVTKDGQEFFGSNEMKKNPGTICPREELGMVSGEGYHLCKEKCHQEYHAEYAAVEIAKKNNIDTIDSIMYLTGHHYCCDNCLTKMRNAGVEKVIYLDTNKEEIL